MTERPSLIATSVVRGAHQGQSHGGVFIIDTSNDRVEQRVDWNTVDIEWQGRGWDRGLRGIAIAGNEVYIAASDELFVYDPNLRLQKSFRNRYLRHCHEIHFHDGLLYLTSTGFDSILVFDTASGLFRGGLALSAGPSGAEAERFDPAGPDGPAERNALHLNNIFADEHGLWVSGMRTRELIHISGNGSASRAFKMPPGIHNAQPFLNGVLFNDTASDRLRWFNLDGDDVRFRVPKYPQNRLTHIDLGDDKVARQGFGRGLCVINRAVVAAGSSPSTVTLYDFDKREVLHSINFSMDVRNAIHGLEVWPF